MRSSHSYTNIRAVIPRRGEVPNRGKIQLVPSFTKQQPVTASSSLMMGIPNPFRAVKNLLGLGDWRNVNIGNDERALFTRENLSPIVDGVGESGVVGEEEDIYNEKVERMSVGLSSRSENSKESLMKERSELEDEMQYIIALEQRNTAQLGSFVDEDAQWEANTDQEKRLLSRKPTVEQCIQALDELLDVMK